MAQAFTGRNGSSRRRIAVAGIALAGLAVGAGMAIAAVTSNVIPLPGTDYTVTVAFSPDGTRAYATDEGNNKVSVIDTATRQVVGTIPAVTGVNTPRGIAATDDRVLVVSAGTDKLWAIDRASSLYTSSVSIPQAVSTGNDAKWIVLNPGGTHAYVLVQSATGSATGSVTAFDAQSLQVTGTATGIDGASGIALSPDGTRIYVSSLSGAISVIDSATMTTIDTINLGGFLNAVVADPRGGHLYVLSESPDDLVVVDLATRSAVATLSADESSEWNNIVISPDGHHVYFTARWGTGMTQVDTEDPTNPSTVQSTSVGRAYGIGIGRSGAAIYAASNTSPGSVTALDTDVPGASAGGVATAGVESATLTWSPPASDGGAPITRYVVTSVEDPGQSCTTEATLPAPPPTTCTLSGLTPGRAYTFTVVAHNGAGNGPASGALGPVTPTKPSVAPSPSPANSGTAAVSASVLPQRARLTAGQTMRLGIRARNAGTGRVAGVVSCVRLPSNLAVVRKGSGARSGRTVCFNQGEIDPGASKTGVITVRAVAARRVSRVITGTVQGTDIARVTAPSRRVVIQPRTPRVPVTG